MLFRSTPTWPFPVSSAAYRIVSWTKVICRSQAEAGGTPYGFTILRILASACRVLPILRRLFSWRVKAGSSQLGGCRWPCEFSCWTGTLSYK